MEQKKCMLYTNILKRAEGERKNMTSRVLAIPGEIFENEQYHSFPPLLFHEEKVFHMKKLPGEYRL